VTVLQLYFSVNDLVQPINHLNKILAVDNSIRTCRHIKLHRRTRLHPKDFRKFTREGANTICGNPSRPGRCQIRELTAHGEQGLTDFTDFFLH